MNHLLIDADRIPAKHAAKLADGNNRLYFFSKHKKVLKKQKQYDCYRGNVAAGIAGCLKEMLRVQDNLHAVVVSPRKKVKSAAAALQAVYPDAEVRVWRKLGKKQRARFAARLPETAAEVPTADTEIVPPVLPFEQETAPLAETVPTAETPPVLPSEQTEAAPPAAATAPVTPSECDTADCPSFQAAGAFIRKNRPKKKSGLLQALCEHLSLPPLAAERLAVQLAEAGKIRVDAAENVRYL